VDAGLILVGFCQSDTIWREYSLKKIILATAVAALASLAIIASASAGVSRYQTQTAKFTVTQPAGAVGQWDNLWTHDYEVTVNPCDGTFTGTGHQFGHDQNGPYESDERITGTFAKDSVSFTATRSKDGLVTKLVNAPFGGAVTVATLNVVVPWTIEMKVSNPVFANTSNFKNHGDYVSSQGGGADAAHSCIGMPIQ
jgi:hypothetical protein